MLLICVHIYTYRKLEGTGSPISFAICERLPLPSEVTNCSRWSRTCLQWVDVSDLDTAMETVLVLESIKVVVALFGKDTIAMSIMLTYDMCSLGKNRKKFLDVWKQLRLLRLTHTCNPDLR